MDVGTLEVTAEEATAALEEYRAQVAAERTREDEAMIAAYRHAARGNPVFSMRTAFDIAGRFDDGLPRIAVIRADAPKCWVHRDGSDWVFSAERQSNNRGALVGRDTVRVPDAAQDAGSHYWWNAASTVVPSIPPRHRPRARRLPHFHILWEVEAWTPEPPIDPFLIRHIRGDLWSVVAQWDLTPIERAVLAQRGR